MAFGKAVHKIQTKPIPSQRIRKEELVNGINGLFHPWPWIDEGEENGEARASPPPSPLLVIDETSQKTVEPPQTHQKATVLSLDLQNALDNDQGKSPPSTHETKCTQKITKKNHFRKGAMGEMPPLERGTMNQRISSLDGQLLLGTSPSLKSPPPPMDSYPLEFSPTFDSSKEEREENDDIDSLASTHPPTDDEYEEENAPNNRHPSLIDLTAPEKPSNAPKPHESFVSFRSSPIQENMSTSVASTLPPAVSVAKT